MNNINDEKIIDIYYSDLILDEEDDCFIEYDDSFETYGGYED